MMNQRGTWQLILMAREGDRSAIDSLFFSSFPSAYLILFNITGSKDVSLKILYDAYLEVFSSLDKIEKNDSFSEEVNKSVLKRVRENPDYGSLLNQDKSLSEKADRFVEDAACFYDFNSVKTVDAASTADCVFTVLNTIPLEKRICLYMYYFVSTSPEAIASVIGADEAYVRGVLSEAFEDAMPLVSRICEKADILTGVEKKAVIRWAIRNTKAFSLSPEEIDTFYAGLIKGFVETDVLDTSVSDVGDSSDFEMKSMKLTKKKNNILKSIFNIRNLIVLLVLAVAVGLAFMMNSLSEYNKRRQEREALTSRTTLRYQTTVPSSERLIFSTEYSYPEETEEPGTVSEPETGESEAVTEPVESSTTQPREQSDFSYTESGSTVTITGYSGDGINITVPETLNGKKVVAIGENAFFNSKIISIKLPSTVTTVGKNAFHSCESLQVINLPIGVTTIGNDAFRGCTALSSVSLPSGLTKIGDQAFYKCTSLKSLALPSTLTSVGNWAFAYCSSLANITIPRSVTFVGASVFYECTGLAKSTFVSPSKITSLGESFFFDCSSLQSVSLPSQVRTVPTNCFYGCKSLESISLTAVTHINESAFEGCSSLTNVTFSTALLKIEKTAFSGCSSLRQVTLPSNTLAIGEKAFAGCTALEKIYIPSSVTRIGESAFKDCTLLKIDCPDGSVAEEYAKKNGIQLYGRDSNANDTYNDDNSNE